MDDKHKDRLQVSGRLHQGRGVRSRLARSPRLSAVWPWAFAGLCAVAAVIGGIVWMKPDTPVIAEISSPPPVMAENSSTIFVHVSGAVATPGVREVPTASRVIDAISAAGGATDNAALDGLNLARRLSDGEQVHVASLEEVASSSTGSGSATTPSVATRINLNRASESELETLPRIGPATAQKIIDYRTSQGPFGTVDELMNVPGIGERTLEGLRDLVDVS